MANLLSSMCYRLRGEKRLDPALAPHQPHDRAKRRLDRGHHDIGSIPVLCNTEGVARRLSIPLLVPAVAEESENDDEAVEELDVEAAQARRDDAALDERDGQRADRAARDGPDAAPGRRAADEYRSDRRQEVAVAGRRPPGIVDHGRKDAGERGPEAHENEGPDADPRDVDPHLTGAVGIVADRAHPRPEPVAVEEQSCEDDEGERPED